MSTIDLNADLGEGGAFDGELLALVSSASIACGGHAGSDETMRSTLLAAKTQGVRTGAHPGFVDAENFGRIELDLPYQVIADQVVAQIERLSAIGASVAQPVSYVKLHGALYNMAARDEAPALCVFSAIKQEFGALPVIALDGSAQIDAALQVGLPVIREGFADRAYMPDGKLMPRSMDGAVLHDSRIVAAQVLRMVHDKQIVAADGTIIPSSVESICLHGDNAAAVELAKAVRAGLGAAGISVRAVD